MRFSVVAAIALLAATPSLAYLEEREQGLANAHIPSEYNAARDFYDLQLMRRADPIAEHRKAAEAHRQKANLHAAAVSSTKDDAANKKHLALSAHHIAEANKHEYAAADLTEKMYHSERRADPIAEHRKAEEAHRQKANLHAAAAASTKDDAAYKKHSALAAHHSAEATKHAYAAADLTEKMYHSERRADPVEEHRKAEAEHRQKANLHSAAAATTKDDAAYKKHIALASHHHAEANKHAYAAAEHASNAEHSSRESYVRELDLLY